MKGDKAIIFATYMYKLAKSILFKMAPEQAHYFTMRFLKIMNKFNLLSKLFPLPKQIDRVEYLGLSFHAKFGMAAGFDKNAEYLSELKQLGFGFVEIGTVTPIAQEGNPQPRLFRLPKDEALINRMGFNNHGSKMAAHRLKQFREKYGWDFVIGGNIGKNKVTSNEDAYLDYSICYNDLFPYVDYFVINVSSPNTPNLRDLQSKEPLTKIIDTLELDQKRWVGEGQKAKPVLLKIAPDITDELLEELVELVSKSFLSGIIATNTTISRAGLHTESEEIHAIGAGGLSGKPVKDSSTQVIKKIHLQNPDMFIIGVGGILNANDAQEKLDAGAKLVQVYSGFIYEGPNLVKELFKL
jgi:dihydroorotate dehydrogenase